MKKKRSKLCMGRIRPMASAFWHGGLRTGRAAAHSLPGPRPRRRGLPRSGPRLKWPMRPMPLVRWARPRPVTAPGARVVAWRPAAARAARCSWGSGTSISGGRQTCLTRGRRWRLSGDDCRWWGGGGGHGWGESAGLGVPGGGCGWQSEPTAQ
jgi:hypothetical protein